jgi:hypothetical protein
MDLVVGPRTTAEISAAVRAKHKPVNDNISLDAYFTTADHVGKQVRARRRTRRVASRRVARPTPPRRVPCHGASYSAQAPPTVRRVPAPSPPRSSLTRPAPSR